MPAIENRDSPKQYKIATLGQSLLALGSRFEEGTEERVEKLYHYRKAVKRFISLKEKHPKAKLFYRDIEGLAGKFTDYKPDAQISLEDLYLIKSLIDEDILDSVPGFRDLMTKLLEKYSHSIRDTVIELADPNVFGVDAFRGLFWFGGFEEAMSTIKTHNDFFYELSEKEHIGMGLLQYIFISATPSFSPFVKAILKYRRTFDMLYQEDHFGSVEMHIFLLNKPGVFAEALRGISLNMGLFKEIKRRGFLEHEDLLEFFAYLRGRKHPGLYKLVARFGKRGFKVIPPVYDYEGGMGYDFTHIMDLKLAYDALDKLVLNGVHEEVGLDFLEDLIRGLHFWPKNTYKCLNVLVEHGAHKDFGLDKLKELFAAILAKDGENIAEFRKEAEDAFNCLIALAENDLLKGLDIDEIINFFATTPVYTSVQEDTNYVEFGRMSVYMALTILIKKGLRRKEDIRSFMAIPNYLRNKACRICRELAKLAKEDNLNHVNIGLLTDLPGNIDSLIELSQEEVPYKAKFLNAVLAVLNIVRSLDGDVASSGQIDPEEKIASAISYIERLINRKTRGVFRFEDAIKKTDILKILSPETYIPRYLSEVLDGREDPSSYEDEPDSLDNPDEDTDGDTWRSQLAPGSRFEVRPQGERIVLGRKLNIRNRLRVIAKKAAASVITPSVKTEEPKPAVNAAEGSDLEGLWDFIDNALWARKKTLDQKPVTEKEAVSEAIGKLPPEFAWISELYKKGDEAVRFKELDKIFVGSEKNKKRAAEIRQEHLRRAKEVFFSLLPEPVYTALTREHKNAAAITLQSRGWLREDVAFIRLIARLGYAHRLLEEAERRDQIISAYYVKRMPLKEIAESSGIKEAEVVSILRGASWSLCQTLPPDVLMDTVLDGVNYLYIVKYKDHAVVCMQDKVVEIVNRFNAAIKRRIKEAEKRDGRVTREVRRSLDWIERLFFANIEAVALIEGKVIPLSEQFFEFFKGERSFVLIENPDERVIELWPQGNPASNRYFESLKDLRSAP